MVMLVNQQQQKKDDQESIPNGNIGDKEITTEVKPTEEKHTEIVNGNGDAEHLLKSPGKEEKTNGLHSSPLNGVQAKRDIEHVTNDETSTTTGEIKKKAKFHSQDQDDIVSITAKENGMVEV